MGKLLLVLVLTLVTPVDRCPEVPLEGVREVGCRIKQESHGWKLWLQLGYTNGKSWEHLEKPPKEAKREFWRTDAEAFERCSEWRVCVSKKIVEHKAEQRRNK